MDKMLKSVHYYNQVNIFCNCRLAVSIPSEKDSLDSGNCVCVHVHVCIKCIQYISFSVSGSANVTCWFHLSEQLTHTLLHMHYFCVSN